MGIPTLIATLTADNDASLADTSSMTSTYAEYMFVCTNIAPATNDVNFGFQVNASGQSGYNEQITSTAWFCSGGEGGGSEAVAYVAGSDQATGTAYQKLLIDGMGNGADENGAVILQIFNPSNTTFVKNFYARGTYLRADDYSAANFVDGYIDVTAAITDIIFAMSSGNFDGVIQIFGIA